MKLTEYTSYLLVLLIALVLTGCSASDEPFAVEEPEIQDTPLSFSAYVGRNSRTAATADEINNVNALAQVGGFGVFGFAHGLRNFDDYILDVTVPQFMVNQQVWNQTQNTLPGHKGDGTASTNWLYAPIHYYDNNAGAKHSFFAYAPYYEDVDMVFAKGMAPQLRYNISQNIDLLWATPTKNMLKPQPDKKIIFNFQHALTKTSFHVAPFVDKVHTDDNHSDYNHPISIIVPEGTTVKVRSIHLDGNIPSVGRMNTETGQWTYEKAGQYFDVPNANEASWTGNGSETTNYYHDIKPFNLLIPTDDVSIEIIYDIISELDGHKTHVTRKAVSQTPVNLEQGKSYNFYLDLGLNSVKFFVTVGDWDIEDNPEETILIETIIPWQAGVSDDVNW